MRLIRTLVSITLLAGLVSGSGYFLLRLRSQDWLPTPGEVIGAPPDEAIFGAIWLLSVSITVWVTLSTVLSVFAYLTRLPAAIRAVEWMTVPPIRRLARRSAALILAVGTLSMTPVAGATELPPVPFRVSDGQAVTGTARSTGTPAETPAGIAIPVPLRAGEDASGFRADLLRDATAIGVAVPVPLQAGETSSDRQVGSVTYTVRPGDDLWSITAAHMTRQQGNPPAVSGLTELWQKVVDLNRDRIRSGNPDLIFPGETLVLPQWPTISDH